MKKYIKNIMFLIVICYALLNLVGLVMLRKEYTERSNEAAVLTSGQVTNEIIESNNKMEESYKDLYGSNSPLLLVSYYNGYFIGQIYVIQMQQTIIGVSIVLGIISGSILTVIIKYRNNKKEKIKSKK